MPFRIEHDDDAIAVISKIEKELADMGIHVSIEDDGQPHDGFMEFRIVCEDTTP